MCGFVGSFGLDVDVERSSFLLKHRGPDAYGRFEDENYKVHFCRLKIRDLSDRANQPMEYDNLVLAFNGEIYNTKELFKLLEEYSFKTHSDTEVLLYTFHKFGFHKALELVEGIFAIAIYDRISRTLLLARDRVGVKPLYYARLKGGLIFSSELKAIVELLPNKEINERALANHVVFLYNLDEETIFKGIFRLKPAHALLISEGGMKEFPYWKYRFVKYSKANLKELVRIHEETLDEAVSRQLVSDVEVGIFLSGGIDSSLISLFASKKGKFKAFTLVFKDSSEDIVADEYMYAKDVANFLSMELVPVYVDFKEVDLDRIVWHLEEPIGDPAAISTYLICKQAGLRVMLSGMGGDEIYGGYPRYIAYELARKFPNPILKLIGRGIDAMKFSSGSLGLLRRNVEKFLRVAGKPYPYYLSYYTDDEVARILRIHYNPNASYVDFYSKLEGNYYEKMLMFDFLTFLPHHNLTYLDRMSMAHSVELRVPLLDENVLRRTEETHWKFKKNKLILRKIAEYTLPKHVSRRRKRGFGAPIRAWLRKNEKLVRHEVENLAERLDIFNRDFVRYLLDAEFSGRRFYYLNVYQLFVLSRFLSVFKLN